MAQYPIHSPRKIAAVHKALRQAFRQAGRGSVLRVEQKLGLRPNYFPYHRRRKKLDFGVLLTTLDELGVELIPFLTDALFLDRPGPDIVPQEPPECDLPEYDLPEVKIALRRLAEDRDRQGSS